jgi:iron complex outermembrane receptor protein
MIAATLLLCWQPAAWAQTAPVDLTKASLEDLMNLTVTSVSRKEQTLSKTGAAIFVITKDDIQRSGAANIPDVLRMAPGVDVAQIDANAWAISIRGFNTRFANKVLVLIDGRTVNTPAFSGVYWDQIDVPLEDIERIEIIRGPGGTSWGANAVNGVINIITLPSKATQGGLIVAGAGSQQTGELLQYGGATGSMGTYRAFAKYSNTDSALSPSGGTAADGWHSFHGGFRFDLEPSASDVVMIQGNVYNNGEGQNVTAVLGASAPVVATFNDPISVNSQEDIQARWTHTLKGGSSTSLGVSYNGFDRLDRGVDDTAKILDIDFQHHFALNSRNDIVWGLGYRLTKDRLTPGEGVSWSRAQRTDGLYSGFIQDEIKITASTRFTMGIKLEHNAYTGFEYEPSAQLVWTPGSSQTIWLSAAQAIRQPSRQDTDVIFESAIVPLGGGNIGVVEASGSMHPQAEQLRDYEAGYRAQVTSRFSLDFAAFRSYYRQLETSVPGEPYLTVSQGPPLLVIPYTLDELAHGRSYGGEAFGKWNVTSRWKLSPGFSLTEIKVIPIPLSTSVLVATPEHQFQLRSALGLRKDLDFDASLYFVGKIAQENTAAYTRLDLQLRWRLLESVELSVTGQNLLTPHHAEFGPTEDGINNTLVRRSVLGKITWRF